jgi:protein-S-isoprenylcysteine O-methyltransferase Ste14
METKKGHPGVYIPPPLIYAAIFFLSIMLEKVFPLAVSFFSTRTAAVLGYLFVIFGLICSSPALLKFLRSNNTLVPFKPASSLQTDGIYAFTRNPMYLGLLSLYIGIAFFAGNWWTLMLIPLIVIVITFYVIKREEKYLLDAFGHDYTAYKGKVRRWI